MTNLNFNFSENIQRGILALAKTNLEFFHEIRPLIRPEYFEYPVHSSIYTAVCNHVDKYRKLPNDDFVVEEVRDLDTNLELRSVESELEDLLNINEDYIKNPEFYLDKVEVFARKQALKEAISESIVDLQADNYGPIESRIKKALLVSRQIDCGDDFFESISSRYSEEEAQEKIPTVFQTLNDNLEGGTCRKELCMVVAAPGRGKSLYLVNQGVEALKNNKKVLYISLEMSQAKIAQRFDSVTARLPIKDLKNPTTQLKLNKNLLKFRETFPHAKLFIKEFPTGQANVNTIRALLSNLKSRHDFQPDVLIVDYLELLRPVREIDSEYLAQQRIAEELRGLCVEMDLLLWTATQPNRQAERVQLITAGELGDSYGKIRTADFAISINQTDEEYDQGQARVYVMKARDSKQKYVTPISVNYENLSMSGSTATSLEEQLNEAVAS